MAMQLQSTLADHFGEQPDLAGVWSEPAQRVLAERYLLKDQHGTVIETPDEMCWRVVQAVTRAELPYLTGTFYNRQQTLRHWATRFYELMVRHDFLPNSPTLMNAGKGNGLQLSACFVIPIEDSLDGIFDSLKHAALIHKSGGGVGYSFSRLRPKGSIVGSTHGVASGPVSFMRIYDAATEQIRQGGNRRGANMGILRVDHPDILEFIDCKRSGGITNFNISVGITDAFMEALAAGEEYRLYQPGGEKAGTLSARLVMDRIIEAAWATGDPGLFFIDRANASRSNPIPDLEQIEATNPCGEQAIGPYDACNLGSINLGNFVVTGPDHGPTIDWARLELVTRSAVRFLDDVIDINPYPLPEITQQVHDNRRIGLGVMGWADFLISMGVRYNSEAAFTLADEVMRHIQTWAEDASAQLAELRGPFPNWDKSMYRDGRKLRNGTRTTIAPTGSISILANCSSGIEPLFALAFQHKVKQPDGSYRVLDFVHPLFLEVLKQDFKEEAEQVLAHVKQHGSLAGLKHMLKDSVYTPFVTAHEINPFWHIQMQASFQKWVDNAISKTVNLSHDASRSDVDACYKAAWDLGCKGVTIFRDGCKGEQVLNVGTQGATPEPQPVLERPPEVKPRPGVLFGETHQVRAPEGMVNVTMNSDDAGLMEVYINVGKAGSDIAALAEAVGRLISLHLRSTSPTPPNERAREIADQLRGIGGSSSIGFGKGRVRSMPDAVALALDRYLGSLDEDASEGINEAALSAQMDDWLHREVNVCPECGNHTLELAEGCKKCQSCGYSQC